jgi:hypothetical protein
MYFLFSLKQESKVPKKKVAAGVCCYGSVVDWAGAVFAATLPMLPWKMLC